MFNYIKKKYNNLNISNKTSLSFVTITLFVSLIFYFVLPSLLNYPPNTINTSFDREVSVIYYVFQYIIAVIGIVSIFVIYFKISLRPIDKWQKNRSENITEIANIRNKCLSFPYKLYITVVIFPVVIVCTVLQLTGSHPAILLFKIGILILSFATLVASLFLIISKNILYPVLNETSSYVDNNFSKTKLSLKVKLVFQLFPGILVTALLISLIGYSRLTVEKGDLLNNYYSTTLNTYTSSSINLNSLFDSFKGSLIGENDFIFIEDSNGIITTSNNSSLSHFFVKYMHELSKEHNNRVYEAYTIDAQGVIKEFSHNNQTYTLGIYYEIVSPSVLYYFLFSSGALFLFNLLILIYITKSMENDIKLVVHGLDGIISNHNEIKDTNLPITSDDILGELVISFNKIQELTKNNINQIHSNQDLLMEKERLASLGQLIGGIAHNLKTPIMSIAGASEGLKDLVKEYDSSISDPDVNVNDHHEIAKDMDEWIEKIKTHTSYMSDIITAVKGQAVNLSDEDQNTFSLEELIKRVNILMRHELKNALIDLNVKMNTNCTFNLTGNVNSLVQVINNMISNSIQAYNGKTNEKIDLIISKDNNKIIISIQDYGCGMSKEVKYKLFKEMVTTKGKNGTGLGLFMSYSTIRAHFNGNITFESEENKGTKFDIILPI